jgi:hypothetical protein
MRRRSPETTFVFSLTLFLPSLLMYTLRDQLMALHYTALDAIMCAALLPGVLVVLDIAGVPGLLEDLKETAQRWCRGNGWHFAWGWSKNRAEEMPRGEYDKGRPYAQTFYKVGQQDNRPWVRQYGEYL